MWASKANKKPGQEENPRAGHTCPRPFSNLFYVACKPAGSNDHGIAAFIRRTRLCVKPGIGLIWWPVTLSFAPSDQGILPDRMIAALAEQGGIRALYPFAPDQIQPASLDLRLGSIAYRVRASFLPGPGTTVDQRIAELKMHEFSLVDGAVLETGCVYIVPLIESLALPPDIVAATNPKSSTGRLDVFTRVIADETRGFDRVAGGYHGPLYAEISPKTFPVLVREGSRLSQLRLRRGEAALSAEALRALHARERLVDRAEAVMGDGIAVSLDLAGLHHERGNGNDAGIVGYRAKRH